MRSLLLREDNANVTLTPAQNAVLWTGALDLVSREVMPTILLPALLHGALSQNPGIQCIAFRLFRNFIHAGIFTVLCLGSLATLLSVPFLASLDSTSREKSSLGVPYRFKHLRPKHNPISNFSGLTTAFLVAALLILFVSSTVFFVINSIATTYLVLVFTQMNFTSVFVDGGNSFLSPASWFRVDLFDYWSTLSGCTGTVSLTINVGIHYECIHIYLELTRNRFSLETQLYGGGRAWSGPVIGPCGCLVSYL